MNLLSVNYGYSEYIFNETGSNLPNVFFFYWSSLAVLREDSGTNFSNETRKHHFFMTKKNPLMKYLSDMIIPAYIVCCFNKLHNLDLMIQ